MRPPRGGRATSSPGRRAADAAAGRGAHQRADPHPFGGRGDRRQRHERVGERQAGAVPQVVPHEHAVPAGVLGRRGDVGHRPSGRRARRPGRARRTHSTACDLGSLVRRRARGDRRCSARRRARRLRAAGRSKAARAQRCTCSRGARRGGHRLNRRLGGDASSRGAPAALAAMAWADPGARRRRRAVRQPDTLGLGPVDDLAEHDRRHRGLGAGDAPQHRLWPPPGCSRSARSGCRTRPGGRRGARRSRGQVHPAPTAAPLTAAIVGSGHRRSAGTLVDVAEAVPSAPGRFPGRRRRSRRAACRSPRPRRRRRRPLIGSSRRRFRRPSRGVQGAASCCEPFRIVLAVECRFGSTSRGHTCERSSC